MKVRVYRLRFFFGGIEKEQKCGLGGTSKVASKCGVRSVSALLIYLQALVTVML